MTVPALALDPATSAAHNATLQAIAAPGAWWNGPDRLAIVRAARTAPTCSFCARRDELSPAAIDGEHDNDGVLPPIAVEAVHAIRNDSGRLTRRWFDDVVDLGLLPEAYVELVAVTASSVIVDTFAQGMGLDLPELPEPVSGAPTLTRSDDVEDAGAWLPLARRGRKPTSCARSGWCRALSSCSSGRSDAPTTWRRIPISHWTVRRLN